MVTLISASNPHVAYYIHGGSALDSYSVKGLAVKEKGIRGSVVEVVAIDPTSRARNPRLDSILQEIVPKEVFAQGVNASIDFLEQSGVKASDKIYFYKILSSQG